MRNKKNAAPSCAGKKERKNKKTEKKEEGGLAGDNKESELGVMRRSFIE